MYVCMYVCMYVYVCYLFVCVCVCMFFIYLQHAPLQLIILHAWRNSIQYVHILQNTLNFVAVRVLFDYLNLVRSVHIVDLNI